MGMTLEREREFYVMGHTKTGIRVWNRTEFEKIKPGQIYCYVEPNGERGNGKLVALEHRKHGGIPGIESIPFIEG